MLMEEVLNNTGWTSADAERIFLLRIRPAMCGSAFTGAHRHHHLDLLVHLVVLVAQVENGTLTNIERYRGGQVALATILLLPTSPFLCVRRTCKPACCAQVWVMRKGGVCVREGDAGATAGFRRVSGPLRGR